MTWPHFFYKLFFSSWPDLVNFPEDGAHLELVAVLPDNQGINGHHICEQSSPLVPVMCQWGNTASSLINNVSAKQIWSNPML